MTLVHWSEKLDIGIKEVDEQHKKLVEIVNRLYDAMRQGKGKEVLGGIFVELIDYTQYHFQTEERMFSQHNYPGAAAHIKEHEDLTEKALELKEKFEAGKITISLEVMKFLSTWLAEHIQGSDMEFGRYCRE